VCGYGSAEVKLEVCQIIIMIIITVDLAIAGCIENFYIAFSLMEVKELIITSRLAHFPQVSSHSILSLSLRRKKEYPNLTIPNVLTKIEYQKWMLPYMI
jgi:hypothetical protein